ncbi:hypothetical protein MHM88_14410 [Epibacterium sp. MM17-32]|uniref:hypothetical protein n=1 Tax=Epibacterium sp. MM17-32 TaxID=2917734 RepID=UPI001EF56DB6|nr:hypothetical protein [Epibacterium sp. MM17-32]MCG7629001.1 hypothetical protein [Epibacterium sp. MM17-32]
MTRQKQVEITDDILAQIERVTGTTVDADNIVVFEAAAASTREIHKMGSIYHGARMTRGMLSDMAEALNSGAESVPLHTLHMQGGEIPVGRVFQGAVVDEIDGSATLRAMFYLPLAEKELIEKINLGILDEVSVGTKSKQALCSKCGFDYFGADADFTHLFSQTCTNGHTIGEDGTHLKLSGLDKWMELSLVSRGASDKPKILSRAKQLLSKEEHDRIAADGKPVEALFLFNSMATETPEMPKETTADETTAEETTAEETTAEETTAEETTAEEEETSEQAAGTETEGEPEGEDEQEFNAITAIEALQAQLAELATRIAPEPAPEPTIEDLQAELAAAQAKIAELSAEPEAEEETTQPELPVGGVAASAVEDAHSLKASGGRAGAFKTKR